jgi:membrane associated rhomboid family serine protease
LDGLFNESPQNLDTKNKFSTLIGQIFVFLRKKTNSVMNLLDEFRYAFDKRDNSLWQIIWINVASYALFLLVFLGSSIAGQGAWFGTFQQWFALPATFSQSLAQPWTYLSYHFVHNPLPFGLLFDILIFYWFGQILEEFTGNRRLWVVYVLGVLVGAPFALLCGTFLPNFPPTALAIGPTAGVMAVVIATATIVPDYTVHLLLFGPVRIKFVALFYLILSLVYSLGFHNLSEAAAVGGALMGYWYVAELRRGRDWGDFFAFFERIFQKKTPQAKLKRKPQKQAVARGDYQEFGQKIDTLPNEAEIDAILDKINLTGLESLSKEERQLLEKASKR